MTAGTFGIVLSTGNSLPFTVWDIKPGWSKTDIHGIRNTGSVAGEVYLTSGNFQEPTGWYSELPEPEPGGEVTADEFAKILNMEIKADLNGDRFFETLIYDDTLYGMETSRFSIGPGQFINMQFKAYLPTNLDDPGTDNDEDDNLYQADGVAASIVFRGTTTITIS